MFPIKVYYRPLCRRVGRMQASTHTKDDGKMSTAIK
jgi:hypothetical protein